MIVGIGTDIVSIARIKHLLERYGGRFNKKICTQDEIAAAAEKRDKARFYALRFAAKEAAWKALSSAPVSSKGIGWHDLEVISTNNGAPRLIFHGNASAAFERMTGNTGKSHITLSDDSGFALAFVVLSAS